MWSEPYGSQFRYLAAFLHTRQVRRLQGEAGAPVTIVSLPGQRAGLEDEETVLTTMGDEPLICCVRGRDRQAAGADRR
jgi:hypothetical protein